MSVLSETTSSVASYSTVTPSHAEEMKTVSQSPHIRHISFGIVVDDYTNPHGSIPRLEYELDAQFDTVSLFKQFGHEWNNMLIQEDLAYAESREKKLLVAWEPWDPRKGMNQTVDYVSEIPGGKHDEYIVRFANQVREYGLPVTIRFGHEMNGNWYPWGNRPEEYKRAYRYIVDTFRSLGVSNVSWMWTINAENVPVSPISTVSQFYPGSEYVDLIGLDGFNFGSTNGHSWVAFSQIFQPAYSFVVSYRKPIVISETASSEIGGDKAKWIEDMLRSDLPETLPLVSEVVWFSLDKEADWRIDSSESSLNSFKNSLNH